MASAVLPQHVQITTPDLRGITQPAHIDPDISATLADFLTYTEHLPSSIQRSLTLIHDQDSIASDQQQTIHDLLTTYVQLPTLENAPDAVTLRKDISHAYDRLAKARRMAAAESIRMADLVSKDRARLDYVGRKLKAMPMPPSRDPTPEPVPSPQLRKAQPTSEKRAAHRTGTAPRVRGRKIMVPGEVLPPPNPDSPPPSEPSDWGSPPRSPVPNRKERQKSVGRPRTPKPPKIPKEKSTTPKTIRVRIPGQPGTNVHSAVAGISTSNALLALVPPSEGAKAGSKWRPWKRLTEFELAKLRKRMKKNAIWLPSPAMRNRELRLLGRGQQAMEEAKAEAEATGEPFVDEYGPEWSDPTKAVVSGEERAEMAAMLGPEADGGEGDDALMNRGMRLNEAKKRKREKQLEEQAVQAQNTTESGTPAEVKPEVTDLLTSPKAPKTTEKKRKRESTPPAAIIPTLIDPALMESPDVLSRAAPQPKKLKLSIPAPSGRRNPASAGPTLGTKIPLAPAAPSPNKVVTTTKPPASPLPRTSSRQASLAPDSAATTTVSTRKSSTKITIKPSKAASAEPPNRRISLRRGSNASLPGQSNKFSSPALGTPAVPEAGRGQRRKKRPAPGLITAAEEGSAKVSVGKRKAAPKKKAGAAKKEDEGVMEKVVLPEAPEEYVDPDEPRYCVCGDVSWGTMIACDNEDCDKEWFHLECVDLTDMPPRRTKWYCPDCRKKLKLGQTSNGIVRP